jgi:hypothetical protein
VRLLQDLKGSVNRGLARRTWLDAVLREVVVEVAFVWAHFQQVTEPDGVLEEQIVGFGLDGTLEAIGDMLAGRLRLRESERWDILFAGVIHARAYCPRHDEDALRNAVAMAKMRLYPPPRRWPQSRMLSGCREEFH